MVLYTTLFDKHKFMGKLSSDDCISLCFSLIKNEASASKQKITA